ncbi:MAG: hypothetical protein M1834_007773 [Cirrosporium novae-zelandiae]|nr:MAG: hypothetical protein M1834_007773 [Cirrosporium novae-zelandiae]
MPRPTFTPSRPLTWIPRTLRNRRIEAMPSRETALLKLALKVILPSLVFTTTLISGSVVVSYTRYGSQPVPSGFVITMSAVFAALMLTGFSLYVYRRYRELGVGESRWVDLENEWPDQRSPFRRGCCAIADANADVDVEDNPPEGIEKIYESPLNQQRASQQEERTSQPELQQHQHPSRYLRPSSAHITRPPSTTENPRSATTNQEINPQEAPPPPPPTSEAIPTLTPTNLHKPLPIPEPLHVRPPSKEFQRKPVTPGLRRRDSGPRWSGYQIPRRWGAGAGADGQGCLTIDEENFGREKGKGKERERERWDLWGGGGFKGK